MLNRKRSQFNAFVRRESNQKLSGSLLVRRVVQTESGCNLFPGGDAATPSFSFCFSLSPPCIALLLPRIFSFSPRQALCKVVSSSFGRLIIQPSSNILYSSIRHTTLMKTSFKHIFILMQTQFLLISRPLKNLKAFSDAVKIFSFL